VPFTDSVQEPPVADAQSFPQAVKLLPATLFARSSTVPVRWPRANWHGVEPGLTTHVPMSSAPGWNLGKYALTVPLPVAPAVPRISTIA
jgi:hypothetical protein